MECLFAKIFKPKLPRILMLADKRGWVFDYVAGEIKYLLKDIYNIDIVYVRNKPNIKAKFYDLLYVFFWGEMYHLLFGFDPHCIIKEVSSYRWLDDLQYGPCTPKEFRQRFLRETQAVTCTSLGMVDTIKETHDKIFHAPNGFDPKRIYNKNKRSGKFTVGWSGNVNDPVKQFNTVLVTACKDRFTLLAASGNIPRRKMNSFYNKVDVFALTSKHEGQSLPVIEAMAAGCFPVCSKVGVVPELIQSGVNGLIVEEVTAEAFRNAFEWCENNLDMVREAGKANAERMLAERTWNKLKPFYVSIFADVLRMSRQPRFRNDDVSCDCPLDHFSDFCQIFWNHGYTQIHGVTPFGRTISVDWGSAEPSQYEGNLEILKLSNDRVQELSQSYRFQERADLIDFINRNPDEIALHGLYHVDYSIMSADEQRRHISEGMRLLNLFFPKKTIRFFIAPYNKVNESLYQVCREFSLTVSAAEGVHLESNLQDLNIRPSTWYRYHHHRFYPESTFDYFKLSLEVLDAALAKTSLNTTDEFQRLNK